MIKKLGALICMFFILTAFSGCNYAPIVDFIDRKIMSSVPEAPVTVVQKTPEIPVDVPFTSSLAWAGFTKNNSLILSAINYNRFKSNESHERHLPLFLCKNTDDIVSFKSIVAKELSFSVNKDKVKSFNEAIDPVFNDKFFDNQILFIAYVKEGNADSMYEVKSVKRTSDCFDIEIVLSENKNKVEPTTTTSRKKKKLTKAQKERASLSVITDDRLGGWFVLISVNKDSIKKCSFFDAQLIKNI